jgi:hypothetical protein
MVRLKKQGKTQNIINKLYYKFNKMPFINDYRKETTMNEQEYIFLQEVIAREIKAKKLCKNVHGRFQAMAESQGAIKAASKLVKNNQLSDGLIRLWENNCLDLSLEQTVLDYPDLFSNDVLKEAKDKLNKLNPSKK